MRQFKRSGFDALKSPIRSGLDAVGLDSNRERAVAVRAAAAAGTINRKENALAELFRAVPEDADGARASEAAGERLLQRFRNMTGGRLADHAVSHAGETAFPRSFPWLGEARYWEQHVQALLEQRAALDEEPLAVTV